LAQRVHDVLSTLTFLRHRDAPPRMLAAVALDPTTGPVLAAALAVAGGALDAAVLDTHGSRFGEVADLWEAAFLPGGARYGDVPAMLALGGVPRLWLASEPESTTALVERLGETRVTRPPVGAPDAPAAAVNWLLQL
jgi:hypothetical protein